MKLQISDQPFVHNHGSWCNPEERVPVRTPSMDDAEFRVHQIECYGYGDASLTNGVLRSSKDVTPEDDGTFTVWHGIDDSYTYFTRAAMVEVFRGNRDIWDGDIEVEE